MIEKTDQDEAWPKKVIPHADVDKLPAETFTRLYNGFLIRFNSTGEYYYLHRTMDAFILVPESELDDVLARHLNSEPSPNN